MANATYLDKPAGAPGWGPEEFSERRYKARTKAAMMIGKSFNCLLGSGARTYVPTGGSTSSYHLVARGALARDFSGFGSTEAERAQREHNLGRWAGKHPELYQEVMVHDVGSGLHAHVVNNADERRIVYSTWKALREDAGKFGGVRPPADFERAKRWAGID